MRMQYILPWIDAIGYLPHRLMWVSLPSLLLWMTLLLNNFTVCFTSVQATQFGLELLVLTVNP